MEQEILNQNPTPKPWHKRGWFIGLGIFIIVWFGVPAVFDIFFPRLLPSTGNNKNLSLPPPVGGEIWAKDAPILGYSDAPISIVEFADFQCPYSKQSEPVMRQLLAKYPEVIKIQFRDKPLTDIHTEALTAAEAANCAGRQNKYWEYNQALFNQQDLLKAETYQAIAQTLGLNLEKFSACLNGHLTLAKVKVDFEAAQKLGVNGTPTFFVNGRRLAGHLPLDLWEKIIAMVIQADIKK